MKSYSNLFVIPFVLIIFFSVFSGFASAADSTSVERLLRERTNIMHKVFFNEITPEKGEELLYEIAAQPLLASDIRSLREYENTDMDLVRDMEILVLEQTSALYGYRSYRGEILWYMRGVNGDYIQSVDYNIVLKRSGSGYKLSEFTAVTP